MKIFIGNLGAEVTAQDLWLLFSDFGDVQAVHVAQDEAGKSKGFAYVKMKDDIAGQRAITMLNKKKFMEQFLSISEALQREAI